MRLAPTRTPRRSAFTLVELLVVIGIIAILVALLTGSVMKALTRAQEVQNRNGITQLSNGIGAFKAKFGKIPPSRIRLCQYLSTYTTKPTPPAAGGTQLDNDSIAFIRGIFPRCSDRWANPTQGILWCQTPGWSGDTILEGEQCIVFFLGGIQSSQGGTNGCIGFNSKPDDPMANPSNPTDPAALSSPIGPFLTFEPTRLTTVGTIPFFAYNDAYDTPYAYFSSYNNRNGYNRYGNSPGDCATLATLYTSSGSLQPYIQSTSPVTTYWNPESFQIISAGANGQTPPANPKGGGFGSGGLWTPATAGQVGPGGFDDISNFYDQLLGHAS